MKKQVLDEGVSLDGALVKAYRRAKRILIITGAGISVSGGIPDFRSQGGLYDQVREKYPSMKGSGKDLFDANVLFSPSNGHPECFFGFMGLMKKCILDAKVTPTHEFFMDLKTKKKLLRIYTQNIDGLEERVGLSCGWGANSDVIQLHGSLDYAICTICDIRKPVSDEILEEFLQGTSPLCRSCEQFQEKRVEGGLRRTTPGSLRPDVVLYNETHRDGETIRARFLDDIRRRPDLVFVMGTSLKVPGCKQLVKSAAKSAHTRNGARAVYVNRTPPSTEWGSIFDDFIQGDCDDFVRKLMMESSSDNNDVLSSSLPTLTSSQISWNDNFSSQRPSFLSSDDELIEDKTILLPSMEIALMAKMEEYIFEKDDILKEGEVKTTTAIAPPLKKRKLKQNGCDMKETDIENKCSDKTTTLPNKVIKQRKPRKRKCPEITVKSENPTDDYQNDVLIPGDSLSNFCSLQECRVSSEITGE